MQTLEFAGGMQLGDPLPTYLTEGTFAMQYLLREQDLISDLIPGIGLIDDTILVKRVLSRNEARLHAARNSPNPRGASQNLTTSLSL